MPQEITILQLVKSADGRTSQLVTWSTRHTEKSCDEVTVRFDGVVTS